jgi:hypothetical protein
MVGGIGNTPDREVFRDEDLRSDRQPGLFQIDAHRRSSPHDTASSKVFLTAIFRAGRGVENDAIPPHDLRAGVG